MVKLQILIQEDWADVSEPITLEEASKRQLSYQKAFPDNLYRIVTV